jgi:hypothetical protein
MAKKIKPTAASPSIETKPEIDYRDDRKRASKKKVRSASPHIEMKPKVVYTEGKVQTWADYTRGARLRSLIDVTAEMRDGVRESVQRHFDMLAEAEELKRLVREGEVTTDDEVLAYFDKSLTKQMAIIARKKEQQFQTSLLSMTPKQREKAIAVRNLTRAVFQKGIDKITSKEATMADARAVLKLYEQGIGPGGEGVLAKLIAEEKRIKALPVQRRPIDLQRFVAQEVEVRNFRKVD